MTSSVFTFVQKVLTYVVALCVPGHRLRLREGVEWGTKTDRRGARRHARDVRPGVHPDGRRDARGAAQNPLG
jgi:hypothetical protein